MVAASLANAQTKTGWRPFDPLRDLGPLADLLELAFADRLQAGGRAMVADLRVMRWVSPLIWALFQTSALFRAGLEGYVWVQDGRLVGNVSVAPAGRWRCSIGNVAVHPDYRGRGIARQLVTAAIADMQARGVRSAQLEVHADNTPALRLYAGLGFRRQSATTDLRRPATPVPGGSPSAWGLQPDLALRPVSWRNWRREYELALLTTPPGEWLARPPRESHYRRGPVGAWLEQGVYRRALAGANGGFDALVKLAGAHPRRLTLLVRPARQAELAEPLAAHVAHLLTAWPPSDVTAQVWADPPYLAEALQRHGFAAELTTVRMALDLRQREPIQIEG